MVLFRSVRPSLASRAGERSAWVNSIGFFGRLRAASFALRLAMRMRSLASHSASFCFLDLGGRRLVLIMLICGLLKCDYAIINWVGNGIKNVA